MKSSWIIWLVPKPVSCDQDENGRGREGPGKTKTGIGVILPQAKKLQEHQKLGEASRGSPLEPLEGVCPADALILDFWPPEPEM